MQTGLERMIKGSCKNCKKEFRKRESKYKFCSISCANRFNLNGLKIVKLPNHSIELAEFIGICLGDGYASRYQSGITLNSIADAEYIPYVFMLCRRLFPGVSITKINRKNENAIDIRINSKTVSDFLRNNGIVSNDKFVPSWILNSEKFTKACIRGLFDTEGSVSFKKYRTAKSISVYKQLNFRNYNIRLVKFVRDYLVLLNLKPTLSLKKSLYISNPRSIAAFKSIIGFNNRKLATRSSVTTIAEYNVIIDNLMDFA